MSKAPTVAVIIPARYASSRFEGKPLALIAGRPMIERTWSRCAEAVGRDRVWVATDDDRIAEHARTAGMQVVMTSADHPTGTDRVAEAASRISADIYVNVQGDEPMMPPADITAVIEAWHPTTAPVVNGMCPIDDEAAYRNTSIPKVVAAPDGRLLYMSRGPVPHTKDGAFAKGWRQVCVYAFAGEALAAFTTTGGKTPLEEIEDIEILRFLELGMPVRMVPLSAGSIAVDHPEDVALVEAALVAAGED
ncbi:MAG: 3-deoxy-manno-octulosonate cytidylyltransferase synthetase [Actinomycetota bacterium]|jgi:3-deoxy-manno-octulosonate cytidylyltransferase (CMP-KDO synthetase)